MKRDSFAKRYFIKIISSFAIILLDLAITLILPRAFSVEEYGYYTFNASIFLAIVTLANLSTSNALNSKYAKRNNDIGLIKFYFIFFLFIAFLLNISVFFIKPFQFIHSIFGKQSFFTIILGLEVAIFNKLYTDVISIYDSIAVTRFPAVMQTVLKIIMALFVFVTYQLSFLNIIIFYIGQITVFILIISILFKAFIKDFFTRNEKGVDLGLKQYAKEFFVFCKPLFLVSIITQLLSIYMDSSLLNSSGPEIRAMYGAATQLNALVVFMFSPFAELSKREFSVKCENKDELERYFIQALKFVMWLTTYFSVFIAVFSDWIIPVIFGDKYLAARWCICILMIYTIYQSWGQVMGSFLYSTEKTKTTAFLGIISQLALFLGIFIFIKPSIIFPNGLGAEGMALTRTVANILYISVIIYVISRELKTSWFRINLIIVESVLFFLILSIIIHYLLQATILKIVNLNPLLLTLIGGVIYTLVTVVFIYRFPTLVGISKDRLKTLFKIGSKNE